MRRALLSRLATLVSLLSVVLLGCGPAPATPVAVVLPSPALPPTARPTPTASVTPSARPSPTPTASQAALREDAPLYSGPGNLEYETVGQLPASTVITPTGRYGDFVQVEVDMGGAVQNGFVLAEALDGLPAKLPELSVEQVPWALFRDALVMEGWDSGEENLTLQDGVLTLDNTAGRTQESWYSFNNRSEPLLLRPPFQVLVQLSAQGQEASVHFAAGLPADPANWWDTVSGARLKVENGTDLRLQLFDQDQGLDQPAPAGKLPKDGQLRLRWSTDEVLIYNAQDRLLGQVSLPAGLFGDEVTLGISAGPNSRIVVYRLAVLAPPGGTFLVPTPTPTPTETPVPVTHRPEPTVPQCPDPAVTCDNEASLVEQGRLGDMVVIADVIGLATGTPLEAPGADGIPGCWHVHTIEAYTDPCKDNRDERGDPKCTYVLNGVAGRLVLDQGQPLFRDEAGLTWVLVAIKPNCKACSTCCWHLEWFPVKTIGRSGGQGLVPYFP